MGWLIVVLFFVILLPLPLYDLYWRGKAKSHVENDMKKELAELVAAVFGEEAACHVQFRGCNMFFSSGLLNRHLGTFSLSPENPTRFHLDLEKGMISYNCREGMRYAYFRRNPDGTLAPYIDLILDKNGKDIT